MPDVTSPAPDPREARPMRRLLGATGLFALAILLSRLLGMVRQMIVANRFGAGAELDAYTVAYNLPFRLGGGIQAITTGALIPVVSRYLRNGEGEQARQVGGTVLSIVLLGGLLVTGLGIALASPVSSVLAPGFDPAGKALVARLLRIHAPYVLFAGVGGVMACIVLAHRRFVEPAAAHVAPNIVIIAALMLAAHSLGVSALAIGTTLGGLAYAAVLLLPLIRYAGRRSPLAWRPTHAGIAAIGLLALPLLLPSLGGPLLTTFEQGLLSGHAEGSNSALAYAENLLAIPLGLLISSLGTVLLPLLSWDASADDSGQIGRRTSIAVRLVIMMTVLAVALMVGLGRLAVSVLYGTGRFGADAVVATSDVLLWLSPMAVGAGLTEVLTKTYHALQDTMVPSLIWLGASTARVVVAAVASRSMGARGIALVRSLASLGQALWLGAGVRRRISRPLFRDALRITITSCLVGGATAWALAWAEAALPIAQGRVADAFALVALGGLATLVYVVCVLALNPQERAGGLSWIKRQRASR